MVGVGGEGGCIGGGARGPVSAAISPLLILGVQ